MAKKPYCELCGNTGEIFETGERCSCSVGSLSEFDNDSICLSIPEQYRAVPFNSAFLPYSLGDYYAKFMDTLHKDIVSQKMRNKNIFLGAPAKSGKTILAYSALQSLFRRNVQVFPLFDVLELRRIMNDIDMGRKLPDLEDQEVVPSSLYTTPYLFVRIPTELGYSVFDTINLLLNRRLRRDGCTILLCDFGWNYVTEADKRGTFSNLLGDGSFGTLENKSFYRKEETK